MSSLVEIRPIHSSDIKQYWDKASSLLQLAIDKMCSDEITTEILYESIVEKERALWCVFKGDMIAAITTRVEIHPTGLRVAVIDFAGGESFDDWEVFTDYTEGFFKSMACSKVRIAGRLGWLKKHKDKGYKLSYCVIEKNI